MHFPSTAEGTMFLWYFVIAAILISLLVGVGLVYGKIIKKRLQKFMRSNERPKANRTTTSTQPKH